MNKQPLFFFILLAFFSFFIFYGISLPYVGPNATNFSVYSLIAHNFNTFGYLNTKFAPVISIAPTLPIHPEYFFHHPTLLSFSESLLFRIFGEEFWVGRLTVIIFSFGSFFLIFFIAKLLDTKKFAYLALTIMVLVPATTLFGKMIGQEPLVLFFCLLTLYWVIQFLRSDRKIFLSLIGLSIILGILSDWPASFFIIFLFPLFLKYKKVKTWLLFVGLSICTVGLLLGYVYVMKAGFGDLQNALVLRTVTGLLEIPYWPIRWLGTTLFRLVLYFNPIFFICAVIYFTIVIRSKKLSDKNAVILGLGSFSIFHILFYSQASFTHPYLILYFLPFVALASSALLIKLVDNKQYLSLFFIFSVSLLYFAMMQNYKNKQIESNIWRYELAREVSFIIPKYEYILNNRDTVIDADILWYPFLINMKGTTESESVALTTHNHFVYSCMGKCNISDAQLAMLLKKYRYIDIIHPKAEAYVFFLHEKNTDSKKHNSVKKVSSSMPTIEKSNRAYVWIRQMYRYVVSYLHIPQL